MLTHKHIHYAATLLLIATSITAQSETLFSPQTLQQATTLRDQALKTNRAYEILESLTTEVGPRLAGSTADKLAVNWATEKFKQLGFDKTWTEPVSYPVWTRGDSYAEITAPTRQTLTITALGGSIATPTTGLSGEIVLLKNYADLLQANPANITGKIVYISNHTQRTQDGSGYGNAVTARLKGASAAAHKGAIALIIRSIGTDNNRLPHTGVMRYEDNIKPIPAAAISNPDADLLENMLNRQQPVKIHLKLNCGTSQNTYTSANVIGEIRGRKRPKEIILLGAHLDSWDLGTSALDDGAGVAIIMETARLISELKKRPARSIRVVLYANEEQGVYGGKTYAQLHTSKIREHIAAIESDLGAGRVWRFRSQTKPIAEKYVLQIAENLKPLGIEYSSEKAHGGADIEPLGELGVGIFELSQDASLYFDYHHTANDTLDKIDPAALNQNVAAYVTLTYLAAQAENQF